MRTLTTCVISLCLSTVICLAQDEPRAGENTGDKKAYYQNPVDPADSVRADGKTESSSDTTSTRTYGTAPGTGTLGAGSGNGDATGNTGTPGSAAIDPTQSDEKKTGSRQNTDSSRVRLK